MTFLLLTTQEFQGCALAAQLRALLPECLCLVMAPEECDDALREVWVDRVICSPALAEAHQTDRPRFLPWPETVTEDWVCALLKDDPF